VRSDEMKVFGFELSGVTQRLAPGTPKGAW